MVSFSKSSATALAVLLACASPAFSWTKDCKDNRCGLSLSALDATTKKPMLTFSLLVDKDQSKPAVVVVLPLGVALEPGIKLVVGEKQIPLAYKVCVPDGCQAYADLKSEDWAATTAAKSVEVRFFALAADKPISAPIDLTGLTDELSKL